MAVWFLSLAQIKRIFQNISKIQDWIHLHVSCIMKKYINKDLSLLNITVTLFIHQNCLYIKMTYDLTTGHQTKTFFLFTTHLNYSWLNKFSDTIRKYFHLFTYLATSVQYRGFFVCFVEFCICVSFLFIFFCQKLKTSYEVKIHVICIHRRHDFYSEPWHLRVFKVQLIS